MNFLPFHLYIQQYLICSGHQFLVALRCVSLITAEVVQHLNGSFLFCELSLHILSYVSYNIYMHTIYIYVFHYICMYTHTYIYTYFLQEFINSVCKFFVGIMHWNYVLSVYDLSFNFTYGILYRLVFQLMQSKALIFSFLLQLICTLRRFSLLKVK